MKVVIASTNPVKINATKKAFKLMLPKLKCEFIGVSVLSGVSDQPMSDKETLQGARNRATNAFKKNSRADFSVGIEGGLEKRNDEYEAFAWVVVKNKRGVVGKGRTATFFLPTKVGKKIDEGMELGDATDLVFNKKNTKRKEGMIGMLTEGIIDRTKYYIDPTVIALIPFKNKNLF